MAYITREDGERFVIPSYRDVLKIKKAVILRREILLLSASYGEYITLVRKGTEQYDVAFSPDPGYLLGETVWHYFKRPQDLIYCEAIPNTTEAILVIVKAGIVYLDGSFPLDSIVDELVIFRTQQNNFEIYIHGDVPISKEPTEGKFAFNAASVKSFTILDKPVFPTLPVVKTFQLQLVNVVLKSRRIGVFPIKQIILGIFLLGLIWVGWIYMTAPKKVVPAIYIRPPNPYQLYINTLSSSPDPATQIRWLSSNIWLLSTIPGWYPITVDFTAGKLLASVMSRGARTNLLYEWANTNHADVQILKNGFAVVLNSNLNNRLSPNTISPLDGIVSTLIDSMSYVLPGNNLQVGQPINKGYYSEREIKISFDNVTIAILDLIGQQFKDLPLVLTNVSITMSNGMASGIITVRALGN